MFTTDSAVIVLDGATAFLPTNSDAATYADHLGRQLLQLLRTRPDECLRQVLAVAIAATCTELELSRTAAPSATVAIVREHDATVDVLVLGDSTVIVGAEPTTVLTDDRLDRLDFPEDRLYHERLRNGSGYDAEHRQILTQLQRRQCTARNRPGGYWIAECAPEAAQHAITRSYPTAGVSWLLAMTDGAALHIEPPTAQQFAGQTSAELLSALHTWHQWEQDTDPNGQQLPRAKRSDDKAIAAIRL